jgi:hypothetical protein
MGRVMDEGGLLGKCSLERRAALANCACATALCSDASKVPIMARRRCAGQIVGLGGLILLIAVPSANASARFASPTGSGSACTQAMPCDIVTAVNSASNNDDVTIEPGTYGSPTPLTTTLDDGGNTLTIHGEAGQPRPVIITQAGYGIELLGNGSSLSDLDLQDSVGEYGIYVGGLYSSTIDHVISHVSAPKAIACYPSGTLTDSVCWSSGPSGVATTLAIALNVTATLRNDTLIASGSAGTAVAANAVSGETMTINLTNSIARGAGADISASSDSNPKTTAIVNADHSNYANVQISNGGGGSTTSVTPAGSATNQTGAPAFVGFAAGNFHELEGSPTIDAGVNSPEDGSTDLDGNQRALPGYTSCRGNPPAVTDIGAYEFVPFSGELACPAPLTPPNTTITRTKLNRKKKSVSFSFQATGNATGFECELIKPRRKHHKRPRAAFSACKSPKIYKHLQRGTYKFEVRALNSAGVDLTPAAKKVKVKAQRR